MFLRLLGVVAESDDVRAKRLLADTLATALRRMDLPGGALSSWGATRLPDTVTPFAASALTGDVEAVGPAPGSWTTSRVITEAAGVSTASTTPSASSC